MGIKKLKKRLDVVYSRGLLMGYALGTGVLLTAISLLLGLPLFSIGFLFIMLFTLLMIREDLKNLEARN
jgi:hypothetical protein